MGIRKQKLIRLVNDEDDIKDLGEWKIEVGETLVGEDDSGTPIVEPLIERYHFVLGAKCDAALAQEATEGGKKGPRVNFVDVPSNILEHMRDHNKTLNFWLDTRRVFATDAQA